MLRITVGGNALTLNDDTTISIEINNSMFESNVISGDITYTFSLPADANNNKILGFANNMSMVRQKQRCTIGIDNITIVDGELWIQHADSTHYEVGVVVNPYPLDFGEKKLTDDDFGNDIIISDELASHQQNWIAFLENTKESQIIKFPLFVAEKLYGDDANPTFGYIYDDNGEQHRASLVHNDNINVKLQKYYVNRLFFDFDGSSVYNGDLGLRVFNKPAIGDNDQLSGSFTFCPAFSLLFILQKAIETAGYTLIGDILDSDDFGTLLIQSLRTLDGKCDDYISQALARVSNVEDFDANSQLKEDVQIPYYLHTGNNNDDTDPAELWSDGLFTAPASGNYIFVIKLNFLVYYETSLAPYTDGEGFHQFFVQTCIGISTAAQNPQPLADSQSSQGLITYEDIDNLAVGDTVNTEITLTATLVAGQQYKVWLGRFVKETITYENALWYEYESKGIYNKSQCSVLMAGNSPVANYNIYTNKIKPALFMPDVSNSEFINAIKDAFGLTFYIDARSKIVEMSYAKNILEARKALDLTPYLLDEETYIDESDDKQFDYTLPPASDNEIDDNSMIDPVDRYMDLPNPTTYLGKCCYVRGYNMIFKAERQGNTDTNWEYKWVPVAGNNQSLVIGEGKDSEKISPKIKIGSMTRVRDIGPGNVENNYKLPCTEKTGVSPLYDTGTTSFDMIILRYLGVQKLSATLPNDSNGIVPQLYIESASPVNFDVRDSRLESGLSDLTALGDDSIGERYIRPLLDFRANSDTVVCQFLLPLSILLQVIDLVRPQTIATSQQVRWCFVQNQRMIPRKITFEIRAEDSRFKTEIEFAKKRNNDL